MYEERHCWGCRKLIRVRIDRIGTPSSAYCEQCKQDITEQHYLDDERV